MADITNVNYLTEINAVDDWELTHPLSANAYKVLRKLLYLANKERFPRRISVPNTVLISLVGCSEDSLIKARNQLIQYGLITYKGQKKMTPVYTINYFSENPVYNSEFQGYKQGIKQGIEQGIKQGIEQGIKQGTYINKIKGDEEDEEESAVAYFERCGIAVAPAQYEAIRDFYDQGITDDMLRFAADEAVEHGALSFAYVRRVVDGWICDGVSSLDDAKLKKAQYGQKQAAERAVRKQTDRQSAQIAPQAPAPKFFADRW